MDKGNSLPIDSSYHYPPELLELLVATIPLLVRSKDAVLDFFKGAGTPVGLLQDWRKKIQTDRKSVNKYEISRSVLGRLNERQDSTLAVRREILKRITEFDDFSVCWPDDRLKAQGLVAQIRQLVNVKDSFTRMNQERARESEERRKAYQAEQHAKQARTAKRDTIKSDLYSLFAMSDQHKRGKALEPVLNRLFEDYSILVRESFTVNGNQAEGIVEQIDGLVELDGHLYLVEMKWWDKPIGVPEMAQHLVRVYHRGETRGIFISASPYTGPAIAQCRDALQHRICILCSLQEIVQVLESEKDLRDLLRKKVQEAAANRNPWHECFGEL